MELILIKIFIAIIAFLGLIIGIALYRLTYEEIEIIKPYIKWTKILLIALLSSYNIYNNLILGLIVLILLGIYIKFRNVYLLSVPLILVIAFSSSKEMLFVNGVIVFSILLITGTYIDYKKCFKIKF
jgi:hypothetical protein